MRGYQVPFPMRGERPVEKEKSARSEGIQRCEMEAWRGHGEPGYVEDATSNTGCITSFSSQDLVGTGSCTSHSNCKAIVVVRRTGSRIPLSCAGPMPCHVAKVLISRHSQP